MIYCQIHYFLFLSNHIGWNYPVSDKHGRKQRISSLLPQLKPFKTNNRHAKRSKEIYIILNSQTLFTNRDFLTRSKIFHNNSHDFFFYSQEILYSTWTLRITRWQIVPVDGFFLIRFKFISRVKVLEFKT